MDKERMVEVLARVKEKKLDQKLLEKINQEPQWLWQYPQNRREWREFLKAIMSGIYTKEQVKSEIRFNEFHIKLTK